VHLLSSLDIAQGKRGLQDIHSAKRPVKTAGHHSFQGSEFATVYVDENKNAIWIKDILSQDFGKDWLYYKGVKVARKSFQEVLSELDGPKYILHEKGEFVGNVKLKENPVIILGDQIGLPDKEEKFALRDGEKISLGKNVYMASSCIAILNWVCDSQGYDLLPLSGI
jgi:tRNA pseudouridine-54 N-methylase